MGECAGCGGRVEESFRFCPWCAAPQRLKLVEFFRGLAVTERDRGKALRVSRYLGGPERHAVEENVAEDSLEKSPAEEGQAQPGAAAHVRHASSGVLEKG